MIEFKQGVAANVPVRLLDPTANPVSGTLYTAVTASIMKSNGTVTTLSVGNTDWTEITGGAFTNSGTYTLHLTASNLDTTGVLLYMIKVTGAVLYAGAVKVVANEEVDTYTVASTTLQFHEGKWKIFTTGPDANRMVVYQNDGVTPLIKFDLKDSSGSPTTTEPFERDPV